MNRWRTTAGGARLLPLCGLIFLPLLAFAGTALIGSPGLESGPDPSILTDTGWAMLPGMGATILPRWTLGNYDPRLEGVGRGDTWPIPAGISYSPDRCTTLTSFPRLGTEDHLPRLLLSTGLEEDR